MKTHTYASLLALLFACSSAVAADTGSVTGIVTSAKDGKPFAGLKVQVFAVVPKTAPGVTAPPDKGGPPKAIGIGTTDDKGLFMIDKIPPGAYTIQAGNPTTGFIKTKMKIVAGQPTTANLKIAPRPIPD